MVKELSQEDKKAYAPGAYYRNHEHQPDGPILFTSEKIKRDSYPGSKIPGCVCPDCGSPAQRTDEEGIAECSRIPGWYFRYKQRQKKETSKTKIVIENGMYREVPVDSAEVIT